MSPFYMVCKKGVSAGGDYEIRMLYSHSNTIYG